MTEEKQSVVEEKQSVVEEKHTNIVEEVPIREHIEVESLAKTNKHIKEKSIELNIKSKGVSGFSLSSIAIQKSMKANQPSNVKSIRNEIYRMNKINIDKIIKYDFVF